MLPGDPAPIRPDVGQIPERRIAVTGALLLLTGFLPWFREYAVVKVSGWRSGGFAVASLLLCAVTGLVAAMALLGRPVRIGRLRGGPLLLLLAGVSYAAVILVAGEKSDISFEVGLFVAWALAGVQLHSAILRLRADRER